MRYSVLVLGVLLLGLAPQENELVVHEWGTFTSVAGADGASIEWRPLAGDDDLPTFVYNSTREKSGLRTDRLCGCNSCKVFGTGPKCKGCGHQNCGCKLCTKGTVRMETPVLYFYNPENIKVSVRVDFPKGRITEWYPRAMGVGTGIDWGTFLVMPDEKPTFLREKGESHYYPARETEAAPVRVCSPKGNEFEKFLFYRGVGSFDLPLSVRLEGDRVHVKNVGRAPLGRIIVFENRGGRMGWTIGDLKNELTVSRPKLDGTLEKLAGDLQTMLVREGLYSKEASAMIKTWTDSWFEEGLRAFYIVPRSQTDEILPIRISPKPAKLVRVLVGRVEVVTPEMERDILAIVDRLGASSFELRDKATEQLKKFGRFAEPTLKRVLARSKDAEVRARIGKILGK